MWQFLKTSAAFLVGLVLAIAGFDVFLGWRTSIQHGHGRVDWDAYTAVQLANDPSDRVTTVVLGDSVAHQLFPPGGETRANVRFLPSNQAISVAGQSYLLDDCFRSFPRLSHVYLFYTPRSWRNNLGQIFTRDYFCGSFHKPYQIVEVLRLKRDSRLFAAHVGRLLLPNILAYNSNLRPSINEQPASFDAGFTPRGDHSEPMLDLFESFFPPAPDVIDVAPPEGGAMPIPVSPVSEHYLTKMRSLCREHGISLHVLPCPVRDDTLFAEPKGLYDSPIMYFDHSLFRDHVHLTSDAVKSSRARLVARYRAIELESVLPLASHNAADSGLGERQ